MANQVVTASAGQGVMVTETTTGRTNLVTGVVLISPSTGLPYSASGGVSGGSSDTTEATQVLVKTAVQNLDTDIGAKADAAATDDTGAFSLIALVKRSLQNWTTLLGRIPSLVSSCLPVTATPRSCVGRQTIALAANTVTTLTVPGGAVAAGIQADGGVVRITCDGTTAPTASVGTRIDDGVIYYVDTSLANVKLLAPVACSAQVIYYDKA